MIIAMKSDATEEQIQEVCDYKHMTAIGNVQGSWPASGVGNGQKWLEFAFEAEAAAFNPQ